MFLIGLINFNPIFFIYMFMDYLLLISIICGSIIFSSHIQPIEYLKYKLGVHPTSKIYSEYTIINIILKGFKKIGSCPGCISFWATFILLNPSLFSFQMGLIIYIITYYIDKKINDIQL